jgi:NAD(P)-dependent dehydrogenase (short-subunit alcohol dehydrogenase family)
MRAINLTAPLKITRAAVPYMREAAKKEKQATGAAKARKIINISSTTGTRGNVGQVNYAAGKAGIIGLTKTLSKEWGSFNIQVNAVAFGFIDTRLTQADEKGDFTEREGKKIKPVRNVERMEVGARHDCIALEKQMPASDDANNHEERGQDRPTAGRLYPLEPRKREPFGIGAVEHLLKDASLDLLSTHLAVGGPGFR